MYYYKKQFYFYKISNWFSNWTYIYYNLSTISGTFR